MLISGILSEPLLCDTARSVRLNTVQTSKIPFNPGTRSLVPSRRMDSELPEGIIECRVPHARWTSSLNIS